MLLCQLSNSLEGTAFAKWVEIYEIEPWHGYFNSLFSSLMKCIYISQISKTNSTKLLVLLGKQKPLPATVSYEKLIWSVCPKARWLCYLTFFPSWEELPLMVRGNSIRIVATNAAGLRPFLPLWVSKPDVCVLKVWISSLDTTSKTLASWQGWWRHLTHLPFFLLENAELMMVISCII